MKITWLKTDGVIWMREIQRPDVLVGYMRIELTNPEVDGLPRSVLSTVEHYLPVGVEAWWDGLMVKIHGQAALRGKPAPEPEYVNDVD